MYIYTLEVMVHLIGKLVNPTCASRFLENFQVLRKERVVTGIWTTTQIYEGLTPGDFILCATLTSFCQSNLHVSSIYISSL